jgi:predicted RNA-binding Zn ribbon-like protein
MPPRPVHDLPERLSLPLPTGEPWWYWLGGRPALDLVNTLRERWRRRVETLVTPADLERWLVQAGVMADTADVAATPEILGEARALREAIDACVTALVDGTPSPPAAVARVDGWLKYAGARPALLLDADGVPALGERGEGHSPRRALGAIALDAARMLGDPAERARVRVCASDTCSARFYDRSPAGRRRWCSMRTCGNEAKARRHRARTRSAAA